MFVIFFHAGRYVDRADEICYESDMLDSNKRILIGWLNIYLMRNYFRILPTSDTFI